MLEPCDARLPRERKFAHQLDGASAVALAAVKPEKVAENTAGNGSTEQDDEVKQGTREVISCNDDARANCH